MEYRNHSVSVSDWEGSFSGKYTTVMGYMQIDSGQHYRACRGFLQCDLLHIYLPTLSFRDGQTSTTALSKFVVKR